MKRSKSTTDIWYASFLKLNGYEVVNFDVLPKLKGRFYFLMTEDQWKQMKLEFNISEVSKVKMHHIALKDMLH